VSNAAEPTPNRRTFLMGTGLALTGLALTGCTDGMVEPGGDPFDRPQASSEPTQAPSTFVAYGDSLTAGHRRRLRYGLPPIDTWLRYVGSGLVWSGGAAISGATAEALPTMLTRAPQADYGIYFFGTNDRRHRRSVKDMVADITAAHDSLAADLRPVRPCLVAVGPQGYPSLTSAVETWNAEVRAQAQALGWGYLDPWGQLRASVATGGAAAWASTGIHRDRLHPTVDGAQLLGAGMAAAVAELPEPD
jgi:lysophospholipase L1-like esterase